MKLARASLCPRAFTALCDCRPLPLALHESVPRGKPPREGCRFYAHDRYRFPFLVLFSPFFFPLLILTLPTQEKQPGGVWLACLDICRL